MTSHPHSSVSAPDPGNLRRRRWWQAAALFAVAWAALAYLVAPRIWELVMHHGPQIAQAQHLTTTSDGHMGDPVNIVLIGSEADLVNGMQETGWSPADPITLETSLRIAADSILRRPDPDAPVSDLFLFDRKQDLAFEQPVGSSPRQRHHVRFWQWDRKDDGRPVWFGAATFDERVGLSYTTGQVTHHIGTDVDAERDRIAGELGQSGCVAGTEWLDGFHPEREGRNGGGDVWRTDGRLAMLTLKTCRAAKP
jgi:hypothetical protein